MKLVRFARISEQRRKYGFTASATRNITLYKLMLLDKNGAPLCPAWSRTKK